MNADQRILLYGSALERVHARVTLTSTPPLPPPPPKAFEETAVLFSRHMNNLVI